MPITPETFGAVESAVAKMKQAGKWTPALETEYQATRQRILQQRPDLIVGQTMQRAGVASPDVAMEPGLGQQIQQGTFTPAPEVARGTSGLGLSPATRETAARVAAGAANNGFIRRTAIVDTTQMPDVQEVNQQIEQAQTDYQRSQEAARQQQAATQEAMRARVPGQNIPVLGGLASGVAQLNHDIMSVGARTVAGLTPDVGPFKGMRSFYDQVADSVNRYAQEVGAADTSFNRPIAGATRSLGTTLLAAEAGGLPAMIGAAMTTQGNQAITEGRDAGLSGQALVNYAATQGALEGAITSAFSGLGFGGVERQAVETLARRSLGAFLKAAGRTTLEELPEEVLTQVSQDVHKYLAGVDPQALDPATLGRNIENVVLQTLLTSGAVSGLQTLQAPVPQEPTQPTQPIQSPQPSAQITDPARLLMSPEQAAAGRVGDEAAAAVAARQRAEAALAAPQGEPRTFAVDERGVAATPEQWTAREQAGQDVVDRVSAQGPKQLGPGARFVAGEQGVEDRFAPPGDRRRNLAGRAEVDDAQTPEGQAAIIARLKAEARTDTMSGLGNKRAWDEGLQAAQTAVNEAGVARPVVYVDLNNTKPANEDPAIRHEGVDKWVREVLAPQLQAVAPDAEVIARHGGDEFGILLPPNTPRRQAVAIAETINKIKGLDVQGGLTLAPSSGVGMLKPGSSIAAAITEADTAMAAAKKRIKKARGEETDSMKVRANLRTAKGPENRASMADRLGLIYDGEQQNVAGKPPLHVFTDKETGSTFMVPAGASEATISRRAAAMRAKAPNRTLTRREAAVQAAKSSVIPPTKGRVTVREVPATTSIPGATPGQATSESPVPTSRVGRLMKKATEKIAAPVETAKEWLSPEGTYKRPEAWLKGKRAVAAEDTIAREEGVQWANRFGKAIKRAGIDAADQATMLRLHETLTGERPMSEWTPEVQDLLHEWRAKHDEASRVYADTLEEAGLVERAKAVRQNLGSYVKSVPAWTLEAQGRIARALKSFRSSMQTTSSFRKSRRDAWVIYDRRGRTVGKFANEGEATAWRDLQEHPRDYRIASPRTKEERAAEDIHDPRFTLLAGMGEAVHDTHIVKLHTDVANTMAVQTPKGLTGEGISQWAKENGLVQLPGYGRYHRLQNKWVPEAVAQDLTEMVDMQSGLQALYNQSMHVWRKGVVVYNPATHMRNVISNTLAFSYLAGNSPANPQNWGHYARAAKLLLEKGPEWKAAVRQGVIGGDYNTAMIARLKKFVADPANQTPGAVLSAARAFDRGVGRVYAFEDDVFKMATWLKYRAEGLTPEKAATEVAKWYPQHDRSSKLAKAAAKHWWGMPFSTFFDQSVRIMGRATKEHPVRLIAMMAAPGMMNFAGSLLAGVSDDEDKILRASQGGMEKYFTPYLPWRDSQGRPLTFDLRYIVPLANDLLPSVSNHGAIRVPWLFSGPVASTVVEQLSGRSLFTGREFKGVGDRVAAVATNLSPLPALVKSAPSRIAKSVEGGSRAEDTAYALVGSIAGLNARQPYMAEQDVLKAATAAWQDGEQNLAARILQTWNEKYRPSGQRPLSLERVLSRVSDETARQEGRPTKAELTKQRNEVTYAVR